MKKFLDWGEADGKWEQVQARGGETRRPSGGVKGAWVQTADAKLSVTPPENEGS